MLIFLQALVVFAGVFEIGFNGQVKCVLSSEINEYAAASYFANYGEKPLGDICKIDEKIAPDFDVLLAGFPCQPFSIAGKKAALNDARGGMFFEILRFLKAKKPRAFLLENVKNLRSIQNGEVFALMLNELENLGYSVFFEVLRARDFGVPQNRERVYIVGFLGESDFCFPKPLNIKTRLGDILEQNVSEKYTISDRLWEGHKRRKAQNKANGKGFGYSLFNADSPFASTISARYYKDGSEILIEQIGKNLRKITPREAARLQGFSDDFKIVVSDIQAYKQFGNSVCVPVIAAIAKEMQKNKIFCEN